MKRKLKLPTNPNAEQKHTLKRARKMHAELGELEIIMSQLHNMLESDQSKQACERRAEIKVKLAGISETRNSLGKGLTALSILPHKP